MPVQDSIHGYIQLDEVEEELLDTPEMQRLRRVKQLGFINFVYPCATHTRFEHSLGAMHLAGRFAESLDLKKHEARTLRAAALLHDVGHGPFSHATDYLFEEHDTQHEDFSERKIRQTVIADVLRDHNLEPKDVANLIHGDGRLGGIIAGHIDVDRMDYLIRDAYYTGVAYGTIEHETIVRAATLEDDDLVYEGRYVSSLESMLTARYLMITPVYAHRTSRIASAMFRKAIQFVQDDEGLRVAELASMDDPEIICRLRESDVASDMMERIDNRELYKVAARFPDMEPDGVDVAEVEEALLAETGMDEGMILADMVDFTGSAPLDVPIKQDDEVTTLEEASALPAAIKTSLQNHRELRIYAPEEDSDEVADAAENVLT